jgi:mono/diheme cytochrome c family protein
MGDEAQPVAVFLQRATSKGSAAREAVGGGFGTLARRDLGGVRGGLRYDPVARAWRAVFVRPLAAGGLDLRHGIVPFSVAVWDGAGLERGGNKALGRWKLLRLERWPADATFLAELAWGTGAGDLGDPRRGQELFEGACTVCHSAGDQRAPPGLAPDLTAIGAIATPAYLRDSILAPSEVIVPSPNPAQHQDRSVKPGPGGAWPPDEAYVWHQRAPDGKKTSTMPEYASMPREDLGAIVAYLRTLGASAPGAGSPP